MKLKEWWDRWNLATDILFPNGVDLVNVWKVGACIAAIMSFSVHHSLVMILIHGISSWLYVLYYILCN